MPCCVRDVIDLRWTPQPATVLYIIEIRRIMLMTVRSSYTPITPLDPKPYLNPKWGGPPNIDVCCRTVNQHSVPFKQMETWGHRIISSKNAFC